MGSHEACSGLVAERTERNGDKEKLRTKTSSTSEVSGWRTRRAKESKVVQSSNQKWSKGPSSAKKCYRCELLSRNHEKSTNQQQQQQKRQIRHTESVSSVARSSQAMRDTSVVVVARQGSNLHYRLHIFGEYFTCTHRRRLSGGNETTICICCTSDHCLHTHPVENSSPETRETLCASGEIICK